MVGSSYRTYTCDLSGMAVPAQTAIVNLSMSDSFQEARYVLKLTNI